MKSISSFLIMTLITVTITACGSTSKVKPVSSHDTLKNESIDLSRYTKVLILDFVDEASQKEKKESKKQRKMSEMQSAVVNFADNISYEIKDKNNFNEILREGTADENTLIISGKITRFDQGNPMLKFMIGFGAGSSHFDALVELKDGLTGSVLGVVNVDKNSWALGGGIAAVQDANYFMQTAAKKIAEHLYKLKPVNAEEIVTHTPQDSKTEELENNNVLDLSQDNNQPSTES